MKQQQPLVGGILALVATGMWSSLPLFVQQVVKSMDAVTAVWYRFAIAGVLLFLFLFISGKLPKISALNGRSVMFVVLGTAGLASNFWLYNLALKYIPPTTSQVLSPLSSFVLLIIGVLFFKEKMGWHQKVGLFLLITGLLLFFNQRFDDFRHLNQYSLGVIFMITSTLVWIIYALAQKLLLDRLTPQQILLLIYIGSAVILFPISEVKDATKLDHFQLICLILTGLNTIIAYGCYAEALSRWDISKVSAVLTQIPVFTLLFSHLAFALSPTYFSVVELNWISYFGAFFVVMGALFSALGHKMKYYLSRVK